MNHHKRGSSKPALKLKHGYSTSYSIDKIFVFLKKFLKIWLIFTFYCKETCTLCFAKTCI